MLPLIHFNPRVAAVDVELGGETIRAGDAVWALKAAANRDPSAWSDPDRFDVTRDANEPPAGGISFGQGIHFCLGAGLARLAVPAAIVKLLRRFPALRLAAEPAWEPVPGASKLEALPVLLA